jgi:predicted MFS family arabinose efflux permease
MAEPRAAEGLRRELSAGLRYVLQVPWLWITIGTFSVVLMVGYAAFQVLLPKLVEDGWHGGVGSYGLLFTLQGVGMVIGSVVVGQMPPARHRGATIYGLFVVSSSFGALLGLSPWYAGAAVLQIGRGICIGYGITLWETMLMQLVPQQMLSRVISMDWFGSIGLLPAGLGIWAALSGLASPGTLIAASSAFCTLLFVLGLTDRRIRAVN